MAKTLFNKGLRTIHCKRGGQDFAFKADSAASFHDAEADKLRRMFTEVVSIDDERKKFDDANPLPLEPVTETSAPSETPAPIVPMTKAQRKAARRAEAVSAADEECDSAEDEVKDETGADSNS